MHGSFLIPLVSRTVTVLIEFVLAGDRREAGWDGTVPVCVVATRRVGGCPITPSTGVYWS
jgi:hypothetical protein